MQALLVGLAVGAVMGVVGTVVLIVDPLRRERQLFRTRIIEEQMRTFAAQAQLVAHKFGRDVNDNGKWSRKATELRAVPAPPPPPPVDIEPATIY